MFLVAGVNGAGKSTYSRMVLNKLPDIRVLDPDAIAHSMTHSYHTISDKQISAGRATLEFIDKMLTEKHSFVVESTISGHVYLNYLKKAKELGFRTILVYVALDSIDKSIQRVQDRVTKGGHDIPIKDLHRRYLKSFHNLKSHIKICDLAYIYDNSDHYRWIAAYRDGILNKAFNIPEWIKSYL